MDPGVARSGKAEHRICVPPQPVLLYITYCGALAQGRLDDGIVPLAAFVDAPGPDAVAMAVETEPNGDHHPTAHLRRDGWVDEHAVSSDPRHNFEGAQHQTELTDLGKGLL